VFVYIFSFSFSPHFLIFPTYLIQLVVVSAVMSAVSTVITISMTRFQVFFVPSFILLHLLSTVFDRGFRGFRGS